MNNNQTSKDMVYKKRTKIAKTATIIGGASLVILCNYGIISKNQEISEQQKVIETIEKKNTETGNELKRLKYEYEILRRENGYNKKRIKDLDKQNKALNKQINKYQQVPIFNPNNVVTQSNTTEEGLTVALKGTKLQHLSKTFLQAEKKYNVNAIFLASIVALESGWGTSRRAIEQNNLTGHSVYGDYSEGTTFSSQEECVLITAKLLRDHYINEGLTNVQTINKKYSASNSWDANVIDIANKIKSKSNLTTYL